MSSDTVSMNFLKRSAMPTLCCRSMASADFLRVMALATATACTAPTSSRSPIADERWHLRETQPGTYHMTVIGASNSLGSTVAIRAESAPASAYGQAEFGVPIRSPGAQRISVTADLHPQSVRERATLWIRADRNGQPLIVEYAQIPTRGTSDWQHQETGFVVPDDASSIAYGVLLQGSGEVTIRHLTIEPTLLPAPGTPMSASARLVLDSALHVARTYALWRDTVTWSAVEARVRRAAAGAREPRDVYPAIRLLAASLGDHHSSFYTPQDMITFRSGANTPTIDIRRLAGGVGYVNSPGYLAEQHDSAAAYVRRTYTALSTAAPSSPCGWIVDLRSNAGGTPEPMFAALEPFFGPDAPPNIMRAAIRLVGVAAPGDLAPLMGAPVAVLFGPQTGSAGERVALAFRQRPRTRSFGRPTAGVATARQFVLLPDGAALAIASSVMDTTRARENSSSITPDVVVAGQDGGDEPLRAASEWIAATGCAMRPKH
jgi:peptidase S41-like protein